MLPFLFNLHGDAYFNKGGWNGHIRIPGIHTYDTQSNTWLPPALNEPLLTGFPQGAGLSAHSAQIIRSLDDENTFSAIIIGREGSLRSQRKAGNIYLLYGRLTTFQHFLSVSSSVNNNFY